jgi:hypothetical protein
MLETPLDGTPHNTPRVARLMHGRHNPHEWHYGMDLYGHGDGARSGVCRRGRAAPIVLLPVRGCILHGISNQHGAWVARRIRS